MTPLLSEKLEKYAASHIPSQLIFLTSQKGRSKASEDGYHVPAVLQFLTKM